MAQRKKLHIKILALLLVTVLTIPSVVKLVHLCEGHEHLVKTDEKVQVYETETKCATCSFHLATFHKDFTAFPEVIFVSVPVTLEAIFDSQQYRAHTITNKQLRAPPIFS